MEAMLNWREIPFTRLLLPFVAGIGLAFRIDTPVPFLPFLLFMLFGLLLVLAVAKINFRFRWLYGMLLAIFLFGFGYQITTQENEIRKPQHFQKLITQKDLILAQVTDFPKAGKNIQVSAQVKGVFLEDQFQSCEGNLLMYLEPSTDFLDLRYGDQILVQAKVFPITASQNPEAFDFKRYQHFQNTHYQLFAKNKDWSIVKRDQGNWWISSAFLLRNHFLTVLKKHLPTKAEYGVAAALILGNKSSLTAEVQTAYASTGATHVLAVSGLHVGFIYMGLAMLLRLFKRRGKWWNILRTMLLIFGVWAFAFITGAPPSVLRAATMFTFIIIGRTLDRSTNIYNTLALSAFCLLCFNPYLLAEVGFQLSYLAILGIVSFQPWIYRLWIIDHPIGDYIWTLMSVGLAAQLTTFPITIFYFHQFPFYFWLSGLIVVPAAMFILGGGLLLFALELTLPFLATLVGFLLYQLIWMTNAVIYLIQQLPAALIQGIWLSQEGMIFLYIALLVLTYIFARGSRYRALTSLILLALFFAGVAWQSYSRLNQKEIILYSVNKNSLLDLVNGREIFSFQSENLTPKNINFAAQNYRWKLGMQKQEIYPLSISEQQNDYWWYKKGFLQFHDQRFVLIDENYSSSIDKKIEVNYLILRNNTEVNLSKLQQNFPNAQWIADASNSPWVISKWEQECKNLNIDLINITESGAQIITLK